jgi:hypothetical protein
MDWDETGYLIVGQDLARGFLPYQNYWELKPPLGFFFYGLVVALFGNSVIALHAFGAAYMGIGACFLYKAAQKLSSALAGVIAVIVFIGLPNYIVSGSAILMEHVAIVPLCCIAYWVANRDHHMWKIGLAIGICALIRTNLLLLGPAAILYYFWLLPNSEKNSKALVLIGFSVAMWIALPIMAMVCLYWYADLLDMFYMVVVKFALSFAKFNAIGVSDVATATYAFSERNIILVVTTLSAIFLLRKRSIGLLLFLLATFASILLTGDKYDHYNIQLVPFVALLFGLSADMAFRQYRGLQILFILCFLLATPFVIRAGKLWNYSSNIWQGKLPAYKERQRDVDAIIAYLQSQNVEGKYVFCPQHPIFNFMTGSLIPNPHAHPNNYRFDRRLKMMYGNQYTLDDLARETMAKKPEYVVRWNKHVIMMPEINPYLDADYTIVKNTPGYKIYRIKPHEQ